MHRCEVVPIHSSRFVTEDLHGMFDLSRVIADTAESHKVNGLIVVVVEEQSDASYY